LRCPLMTQSGHEWPRTAAAQNALNASANDVACGIDTRSLYERAIAGGSLINS
jgi:hypothetical protein